MTQSRSFELAAARLVFLNDQLVHATTEGLTQGIVCVPFAEAVRPNSACGKFVLPSRCRTRRRQIDMGRSVDLHSARTEP